LLSKITGFSSVWSEQTMAANQLLESNIVAARTVEFTFAGDGVLLAGQIDYPASPRPAAGYPLIFVLHHAGGNTRADYNHYARVGMNAGYAVFRWDKRGTGRSGAGGRGSTTQDAVNAYEIALEQPNVDHHHVVILAQGAGTTLLGSSFGLFARLQKPYGVILAANMLDERAVLAIDSHVQIIVGERDWIPWKQYAKAACDAHNNTYKSGASYYVAPYGDRTLMDTRTQTGAFHEGAAHIIEDWLLNLCPASASI
jgi:alpha-beta hydrolase superfamily lysophospholipase